MAEALPIDIHSGKLLDWLISRRHCNKDWQKCAVAIREKISAALSDMPENQQIVDLLTGGNINYFSCVQIVELLKHTEKDSRNVFGYYSSQRMKDWQEILTLYRKDAVYLAESAQILQRVVQYEIPVGKKQIAKCHQICEESAKKQIEYQNGMKEHAKSFKSLCNSMNIDTSDLDIDECSTDKIERVLKRRLAELALGQAPNVWRNLDTDAKTLADPVMYYRAFGSRGNMKYRDTLIPLLKFFTDNPRATVYQWRRGNVPKQVTPINLAQEILEQCEHDDKVDSMGDGNEINLDLDLQLDDCADLNLDFELTENPADAIDFGIETVESASAMVDTADGIARGEESLTLYENETTCRSLISDLDQLSTFLQCRLREINSIENRVLEPILNQHYEATATSFNFSGLKDESGSNVDLDTPSHLLEKWLKDVHNLKGVLGDKNARHWVKMRTKRGYLNSVCTQLIQPVLALSRSRKAIEVMSQKCADAKKQIEQTTVELRRMASQAKELQAQIESDISSRYKDRPVHIMGGIQSALADL